MPVRRSLVLASLLFVLGAPTPSLANASLDPGLVARIDAYLDGAFAGAGLPGLAVAVVTPDGLAYARAWGSTDGVPHTADTSMEIGSLTKSMTALMLLQLQDEGRLSVEDPVVEHLPWFALAGPAGSGGTIRIADLLAHASGLPTSSHGVVWRDPERIAPSIEEATRALATVRADPSATGVYANMNYVVAGSVIEAVTGLAWSEALTARILMPLGMARSAAEVAGRDDLTVATSHVRHFGLWTTETGPSPGFVAPAGSQTVASVSDMAAYLTAWLAPGTPLDREDGRAVVSEAAAESAFAPRVGAGGTRAFGLGWQRDERGGAPVVFHPGGTEGGSAYMALLTEAGLGFVVLANVASQFPRSLTEGLVDLALGQPAQPPAVDGARRTGHVLLAITVGGLAAAILLGWRVTRALRRRAVGHRGWVHGARTAGAVLAAAALWVVVPSLLRTIGVPLPFGVYGFTPELLAATVALLAVPTAWAAYFLGRWVRDR